MKIITVIWDHTALINLWLMGSGEGGSRKQNSHYPSWFGELPSVYYCYCFLCLRNLSPIQELANTSTHKLTLFQVNFLLNIWNKIDTNLSFWIFEEIPDSLYIPSTTPCFSMNSLQLFTTCGTTRDSHVKFLFIQYYVWQHLCFTQDSQIYQSQMLAVMYKIKLFLYHCVFSRVK